MKNQQKSLVIITLTQMWEQYGYFILQPILFFFLTKKLAYSDAEAYALTAQFSALAFFSPALGGWFADKVLGKRVAILLGGLTMTLGYVLVAIGQQTFTFGLAMIIVGCGLFVPTMPSFLGEFYPSNDPRRESSFTFLYVAMNLGALLAMFSSGYIQLLLGWRACFITAAIMMLLGVMLFRFGFRYFDAKGFPPRNTVTSTNKSMVNQPLLVIGVCCAVIIMDVALVQHGFGTVGLLLFGIVFFSYVIKISFSLDTKSRNRMFALLILLLMAIFYKSMFFETYFVVNVFTDRAVDRNFMGHTLPAILFLGLGGLFTLFFGPIWAYYLRFNGNRFSIPLKFSLSILIFGIAMQLLAWVTLENHAFIPAYWIIIFRAIFASSELLILPIGMSMIAAYAPKEYVNMMMGGWFMSAAFGSKLAGLLANLAVVPKGIVAIAELNTIYHDAFQIYAVLNFIAFCICLAMVPTINKLLSKGVKY